jgi:hypothetical protein
MFNLPDSGIHPFIIGRKDCHRNLPAQVGTMPDTWIAAKCPLCRVKRRYLRIDIFEGRLCAELLMKPQRAG